MTATFRHAGIVVKDMERAVKFYSEVLGFRMVRRMDESGPFISTILKVPGVEVETAKMEGYEAGLLEFLCFKNPPPNTRADVQIYSLGPTHIALTVCDIEKVHSQMKTMGLHFNSAPQVSQDGRAKVAFGQDPEGNWLELVEMLPA